MSGRLLIKEKRKKKITAGFAEGVLRKKEGRKKRSSAL